MHGISTMHGNIRTDIRIAGETGYDGLEIIETKLLRFLDCGYSVEDLLPLFKKYSIRPVCINALKNIERIEPDERRQLMTETERLCAAAKSLACPTVQLVPFCGLEGRPWPEIVSLTAANIAAIADIGKRFGVRFQLEPIAWSPIHSLSQSLEILQAVQRENVGMVIDFWHLWAGEETFPEEVAGLSPSRIYGVHFCDGIRNKKGDVWVEETLRGFLPGEGDIPLKQWVEAVKSTGFDGVWSPELYSPRHWEWDVLDTARETKKLMEEYTH